MSTTDITPEKTLAAGARFAGSEQANSRYLGLTLAVLFLTAAGVQNAIVLTWINVAGGNASQPGTIYGLALVFTQQGLVALYCGFSRQHIAVRTALFLATVLASGDLACRYDGRPGMLGTWMLVMLAHGMFVIAGVWWGRIVGVRLRLAGERDPDETPWQFTLLRLFAVTTVSAAILGVFSYLRINHDELPQLLLEATLLGVLPLQVCFCVLMNGQFFTIVKVGFAAICLATTILTFLVPDSDVLSMLWLTLLQSLMLHAAMSIVQQAGYRIVERCIAKAIAK